MNLDPKLEGYKQLAQEMLKRVIAEVPPNDLHRFVEGALLRLGGDPHDEEAVLLWHDSLAEATALIRERLAAHAAGIEPRVYDWPWRSWNKRIDPLEPGLLALIAAADGMGKTIYAEMLAEHWAKQGYRVAYVHFELNRDIMHERRMARHAGVTRHLLRYPWQMSPAEQARVFAVEEQLAEWEGRIHYVYTPGWSMERVLARLDELVSLGQCDIVVLDYLEKCQPSERQSKLWGASEYGWEKDNVEQAKNWAELTGVPVVLVSQFRKASKQTEASELDRTAVRGAGEKTERSNLAVLLQRERIKDGYSNEVDIVVDKNTLGPTGQFKQLMRPEYFRVQDLDQKRG